MRPSPARAIIAALIALFTLTAAQPALALKEVTVYLTGASIEPGRTVTYRVVDRMCVGLPMAVTVRGGDLTGQPVRICAFGNGGAIGIIRPDGSAGPGVQWLFEGSRVDPVTGAATRPPGWSPPVVKPAPPPAPRGTPSSSVDPERFVGRWSGSINEPAGMFKVYTVSADIRRSENGAVTATVSYSAYNCSGVWTAYRPAGAPAGAMSMYETINDPGKGCADSGYIRLIPRDDGRLTYEWRRRDSNSEVLSRGLLTRR